MDPFADRRKISVAAIRSKRANMRRVHHFETISRRLRKPVVHHLRQMRRMAMSENAANGRCLAATRRALSVRLISL
jgi:hypothetical protein